MPSVNPPVYYPSLVCNLTVRFDEALHGIQMNPLSLDDAANGNTIATGKLPVISRPDKLTHILRVVPMKAHVEIPGFRQAGKFTLELPWSDLPFEPDILRAVLVQIHLGTVSPYQWAKGNTSQPVQGRARTTQLEVLDASNELMVGFTDIVRTEHAADRGDIIQLEGRDLRGTLIDGFVRPAVLQKLNLALPIHEAIHQIIRLVPLFKALHADIKVVADPNDWPGGRIPAPNAPEILTRVNLGAAGQAGAPNPPTVEHGEGTAAPPAMIQGADPTKIKLWDVITQLCTLVGAVPYFVGTQLRIRPGTALYDSTKASAFSPDFVTPFANGQKRAITGAAGTTFYSPIRVMAYGRDITKLVTERKTGGIKVPCVEVVSIDTSSPKRGTSRLLVEQWPPQAGDQVAGISAAGAKHARTTVVGPDGIAQTEIIRIGVAGIRSRDRLRQIARDIYEEIGRGEIHGTCSTKDLASLGGDNSDPDLLHLRPGDPVQFEVDTRALSSYPPAIAALPDLLRRPMDEIIRQLTAKLGDAQAAQLLAYSLTGRIKERQPIYRTTNVRYSWESEKGVGIDFEFQNYIESRASGRPAKLPGGTKARSATIPNPVHK